MEERLPSEADSQLCKGTPHTPEPVDRDAEWVASLLGVRKKQVYELVTESGLPAFNFGRLKRFRESEVLEWVESRRCNHSRIDSSYRGPTKMAPQKHTTVRAMHHG